MNLKNIKPTLIVIYISILSLLLVNSECDDPNIKVIHSNTIKQIDIYYNNTITDVVNAYL